MVGDEAKKDWHSTQNTAYLDLLESRLREPRLIWVDQFVEIINEQVGNGHLKDRSVISINDYGCNVGHFFRGVDSINCEVNYRGFDISDTYLSIAQRVFGDQHFRHLDIEQLPTDALWPRSDVAVISATLEHLEYYGRALTGIFSRTRDLVIIRTFVGEASLMDQCRTVGASSDYLIRQFTIDDLTAIPIEAGWKYRQETDEATSGKIKMVCNGDSIPRAQTVIVFTKYGSGECRA